ncbi:MAG: glycosyltransferase family 4 protein [Verrucomicrobia bacterium]|nr:glycosyltransferase family 4 protein [Verrucomicrobiota bacterium]
MSHPLRILMLTCHPGIRGPFARILPLLAAALRAQGCTVVEEPWGRHRDEESFFTKVADRPGDIARVWRRLRREKFDMLHLHTTTEWANYSRDLPMLWLGRRLVRRCVLQFHGSTPDLVLGAGQAAFKRATRQLLRLTDGVFVLSSEERQKWNQFFPEGRFDVICNPYQQFCDEARNGEPLPWNLPSGVQVLIFVGRLIREKGIYDLLDALALWCGEQPFHLLMAGQGPEEDAFRGRVAELGLQTRVTLTGYLDSTRLPRAYRAADVFVLPSWSEGFPTVITEAMDAGLPVVTTRLRGAADHLQEGVHACFVPPRAPEALAEALRRVLNDRALRARMSEANRAKVREFAPDMVARHQKELLEEILAGKARG